MMNVKIIFPFFVLFTVMFMMISTTAFADHTEVTISPAPGSSSPGCETTADGCFIPNTATIDVGGKVIMSNTDTAAHTFTAGTADGGPSGEFDTGLLMAGNSFEWTPTAAGEVPFFCMVHPWMKGLIIVQEAGHDDDMMADGLTVTITDSAVKGGTKVDLEFSESHVNYVITATQNGEKIFEETAYAMEHTATHQIDAVGSDANPINIEVVSLGIGAPGEEDIWTEPTGVVATTKVVPEFGSITMMILVVAIISIIAVTAKFRLASGTAKLSTGNKPPMGNTIYKLSLIGIVAIIIFGISMAVIGYNSDIYPLDRIRGHLDGIVSSSDPVVIRNHLLDIQKDLDLVMKHLPETTDRNGKIVSKNPVWIFATESTNFLRIQNDVDSMLAGVDEVSSISKDNSAYHTAMLDINDRAMLLKTNIMDATPYMYVSPANMMFSTIWIAVVIGIFAILKRKKEQFKETDEIGI